MKQEKYVQKDDSLRHKKHRKVGFGEGLGGIIRESVCF